jgi:hypothetical protein
MTGTRGQRGMTSRMSDTQYGVLYKMNAGWGLRSCLDSRPWLTRVVDGEIQTSRLTHPTLNTLAQRLWVIQTELKWPILKWKLTTTGREALHQACLKREAMARD